MTRKKQISRKWIDRKVPRLGGKRVTVGTGSHSRDEAGAVLILALLFLVVVGLLVGGLASWTANDLGNSLKFQQDRSAQYALSSTTQTAIQNIRYTPLLGANETLNASPPSFCWGSDPVAGAGTVSELTVQSDQVAVWCSTLSTPGSQNTRVVTVSACLTSVIPTPNSGSSLASVQSAGAACAQSPGLKTVVTFDDYSEANPTANPGVCLTPPMGTCGSGMTINSSTIGVVGPTVTGLSSATGLVTGLGTLIVTGTGFVSGASVNFVGTNALSNSVIAGISPTVTSPTSLSVTIPPSTWATSYYVIVSTVNGSSPVGPNAEYTYQQLFPPTVTGISTSNGVLSGSAAGGTSITITGTGFLANPSTATTVTFVDTANPGITVAAPFFAVNGYQLVGGNWVQTITATTPGIAQDTTYYVVVKTTPGGSSTNGPGAPVFTFQPLTPLVASVNPTSGGAGTSITITGIGFVNGSTTVQLVPTSGNGSTLTIAPSSILFNGSTSLSGTIPTGGTNNQTYYVDVTTSSGGSSCPTTQQGGCAAGGGVAIYTY